MAQRLAQETHNLLVTGSNPVRPTKYKKMEEKNKIYRPKGDRVVAGVCSGIAYNLNIDPIILRVLSFCLIFSPFPIILVYILLWLLLPKEKE